MEGEFPAVPGEIRKALGGRIRIARKTRLNNMPLEEFGRQVAKMMGRPRAFSNVTVSNWETCDDCGHMWERSPRLQADPDERPDDRRKEPREP